jgi:putative hydrolase of the HAD superfamily
MARSRISLIGVDGDDTLWQNEDYFRDIEAEFVRLMTRWSHGDHVAKRLLETERRNLSIFGYGVKGFILSMIETAIELSSGEVPASDIHRLIERGKSLLSRPHAVLPGVAEALERMTEIAPLALITKGDLMHQETKVAASGLAASFGHVHIVSEKDPETYAALLALHEVPAAEFVMIGNSARSDVLPVIDIGGRAIHVPYSITWELEQSDDDRQFPAVESLGAAAELIASW